MKLRKILADRVRGSVRGDAGVAAVVVAVSLLALLGAAMISIDAGSVWVTRREAVTSTDAASLGAGRYLASSPLKACEPGAISTAEVEATSLVTSNRPGSKVTNFNVSREECTINAVGAGTVEVEATGEAPLFFAPVFNINKADVPSSSKAQWGPISEIQRLRPIAFCIEDPHVQEWINLGRTPGLYNLLDGVDNPSTPYLDHPGNNTYPNAGVVHRIAKTEENDCVDDAEPPGRQLESNWAWIHFHGNSSDRTLSRRLENGFDKEISLGAKTIGDEDCWLENKKVSDPCEGQPETSDRRGRIADSLEKITCGSEVPTEECRMFPVLIYDTAEKKGSGGEYHPYAYVGVVLRAAVGFGNGGDDDDDDDERTERYFDLEFVNLIWQGTIAPRGEANFPVVHAVQICRTDQSNDNCDV